jgi:hypothetical protein
MEKAGRDFDEALASYPSGLALLGCGVVDGLLGVFNTAANAAMQVSAQATATRVPPLVLMERRRPMKEPEAQT